MSGVPPDFGGFLAYWIPEVRGIRAFGTRRGPHLVVSRYGDGKPVEGMTLTPLNVLQLHKTLGELIRIGAYEGYITDEHHQQSDQLPTSRGLDDIPPRGDVDEIAGSE